jgi:predicted flap endonuclease-1-like 5' DNA nuclease
MPPVDDPHGFAARNVRFFRSLAMLLAFGVVVAFLLGFGGVTGPGLFDLDAAVTSALFAMVVISAVLVLFLLRIGVIFDIERQVKELFGQESGRLERARLHETENSRAFRDELRNDLASLRSAFQKDMSGWNARIEDAIRAAERATAAAKSAMEKADAMSREPAYRGAIEALQASVGELTKDVADLRTRDRVNSPLLKELQEAVVQVRKEQTKLGQNIEMVLERIERRDLEQAAVKQSMEADLADLKRRESLLLIKNRDLEQRSFGRKTVVVADGGPVPSTGQSVAQIEGIGEAYAQRLAQMGIGTIPRLLESDPEQVGPSIGAMPDLVREWQSMGQLMRLQGIGPQQAEALVRAGVRSIAHLAAQDGEELATKVRDLERGRKTRIQGTEVTSNLTRKWIRAAREGALSAV